MKVGILGSGLVGRVLGAGFLKYGHGVMLGTRNPDKPEVQQWLRENPGGSAGRFDELFDNFGNLRFSLRVIAAKEHGRRPLLVAGIDHSAAADAVKHFDDVRLAEAGLDLLAEGFVGSGGECQHALNGRRIGDLLTKSEKGTDAFSRMCDGENASVPFFYARSNFSWWSWASVLTITVRPRISSNS
jgi:hypothetical protein